MKKRIISLLLITTMSMSLIVGCGNKEVAENTEKQSVIETVIETENESVIELETETSTEIETTVETETTEQEETVTTETTTPTYTYTDMSQTMYAKQSVNVRNLPSTDGEKLGSLLYAQEIKVTGQCVETKWYRIEFNGSVGYVSNNYLVTEKPAEQTTTTDNGGGSTNGGTTSSGGRYGGYWDVEGSGTYTGATVYTNPTYGTSFTVPSTATIWGNDRPEIKNSTYPILLTKAAIYDADICIALTFSKGGTNEIEALEDLRWSWSTSQWTCSDIYTTNIGGNTYYCMEATSPNGYSNELMLARQTGGKVIVYELESNSTKITVDTAKQYILY